MLDIITTTSEASAESFMGKEVDRLVETQSFQSGSQHLESINNNESSLITEYDESINYNTNEQTPQLKKSYSFSVLTSKLNEFTSQRDENAISLQTNYLMTLQVNPNLRNFYSTSVTICECRWRY